MKMKEYQIVRTKWWTKDTELMLNNLANEGWEVAYLFDNVYFLLEREKQKRK